MLQNERRKVGDTIKECDHTTGDTASPKNVCKKQVHTSHFRQQYPKNRHTGQARRRVYAKGTLQEDQEFPRKHVRRGNMVHRWQDFCYGSESVSNNTQGGELLFTY